MRSLWLLTKKNLRLLIRAKSSALIIIFAPLLIILILGLSFNTSSKYGLNIGVHATSFTEEVNSFITLLEEEEFTITRYESSTDNCIADIKNGKIHTCIALPESLQIEDNSKKEITFYVDPSKINLIWMIQETVQEKFNLKAQELSEELSQNILTRLTDTKNGIEERKIEITGVKEKSSAASGNLQSAKTSLDGVDTAAPDTSFDQSALIQLSSKIDESAKEIEKSIKKVDDSNLTSSEKTSIKKYLNNANIALSEAFNSTNGTTEGGISGLISALQNDLDATKNKLNSAAETMSSTSSTITTTDSAIQESITALDNIYNSLTEINNNIEAQKVTEAGTIAAPLTTKIEKVSEESTYLNYLFPAILVLVIMFSSLLLGTTLVMMEKHSPAFLRNFFLPIRKTTFIISIYLTNLVLVIVQILIILGISLFFLKDSLPAFPAVALILFLTSSVFTFLGMTIGYLFTSEETGILGSISLGSVLLFLSGAILPLEGVSSILREFMNFNPFVIAEKLVREVFLFQTSLVNVWPDLALLCGYVVVLFLIILIIESVLHQHIVERFMRHHHTKQRHNEKKNKNKKVK